MLPVDPPAVHSDRSYRWVGAWSERRARLTPDAVGLRDATTETSFTYRELDARAKATAQLLLDHGVAHGERVAVISRNRPELVDLFFATGKTGGVLAPLSHRLAPPEVSALLEDIEPSLLVVEEPFEDLLETVLDRSDTEYDGPIRALPTEGRHEWPGVERSRPAAPSPIDVDPVALADPHLFLHTGGSTGTPKVTSLTHGSIYWNSFNTITAWGLRPDDVTPMVFPMFHTGGWNVLTVPFFHMGATVVVSREFEPGRVLRQLDDGATVLVAVPAMYRMLTEHDDWPDTDLSELRFAKSGGGPCRGSVMREWWDRGVDLTQGYGLTECGPNNFAMPEDWSRNRADSVGTPVMHVDARIVDDEGTPVEPGAIGELELASPHAAAGYWGRPDEAETTFGGGWVSTGDLARVEDGYYYIEGRKKNLFVSGGENVYPAEVENVVTDHPKVDDAVVIGVPDERWGQVGKAVIVGDPSINLDELRSFLGGKLAGFKQPRHLAIVDELPMSGPSKIDREAIKEQHGTID